jgi:hypothetical protein
VRSRDNRSLRAGLLIAMLLAAPASARQPASPITDAEVDAAVGTVGRDPNFGSQSTMKMLRWRETTQPTTPADLSWLTWVAGLIGWVTESARYLMWAGIALLVAWIGMYLTRAIRGRQPAAAVDAFVPPTHVRDLDIRPESLPSNVGHAARKLWDSGDHRAALSLLYRGLLSRLTHVHRVPIRDSSTEGDCLALASGQVAANTSEYCVRLIDAWQGFVYGGTATNDAAVHALCDGFAGALDRGRPRPTVEGTR